MIIMMSDMPNGIAIAPSFILFYGVLEAGNQYVLLLLLLLSQYSFPIQLRLSWPEWMVAYQDGILSNGHPFQS